MIIIHIISYAVLGFLSLTTGFYALQVFCSLFSKNRRSPARASEPETAIIIPAHNEERVIEATLHDLIAKKPANARIIIVADNCSDQTANIAGSFDVEVIERNNSVQRGKGYALEYGINHLKENPPEVVIIFDADCIAESDSLQLIVVQAHIKQRPVQALYLMENPENAGLKQKVAAFAFYVKNYVRPLGLKVMGLPCQLMGTGMAFPWDIIKNSEIGNGNIVEDMKLGIDLVSNGNGALFYPAACVKSKFPSGGDALESQRTRWEHGHMHTIFSESLPLFLKGLLKLKPSAAFFAIDLAILPLSLLVLFLFVSTGLAAVASELTTDPIYLTWSITLLGNFVIWSLLAWFVYGRKILSFSELAAVPFYMLSKIPIYLKLVGRREKKWKRTDRDQ